MLLQPADIRPSAANMAATTTATAYLSGVDDDGSSEHTSRVLAGLALGASGPFTTTMKSSAIDSSHTASSKAVSVVFSRDPLSDARDEDGDGGGGVQVGSGGRGGGGLSPARRQSLLRSSEASVRLEELQRKRWDDRLMEEMLLGGRGLCRRGGGGGGGGGKPMLDLDLLSLASPRPPPSPHSPKSRHRLLRPSPYASKTSSSSAGAPSSPRSRSGSSRLAGPLEEAMRFLASDPEIRSVVDRGMRVASSSSPDSSAVKPSQFSQASSDSSLSPWEEVALRRIVLAILSDVQFVRSLRRLLELRDAGAQNSRPPSSPAGLSSASPRVGGLADRRGDKPRSVAGRECDDTGSSSLPLQSPSWAVSSSTLSLSLSSSSPSVPNYQWQYDRRGRRVNVGDIIREEEEEKMEEPPPSPPPSLLPSPTPSPLQVVEKQRPGEDLGAVLSPIEVPPIPLAPHARKWGLYGDFDPQRIRWSSASSSNSTPKCNEESEDNKENTEQQGWDSRKERGYGDGKGGGESGDGGDRTHPPQGGLMVDADEVMMTACVEARGSGLLHGDLLGSKCPLGEDSSSANEDGDGGDGGGCQFSSPTSAAYDAWIARQRALGVPPPSSSIVSSLGEAEDDDSGGAWRKVVARAEARHSTVVERSHSQDQDEEVGMVGGDNRRPRPQSKPLLEVFRVHFPDDGVVSEVRERPRTRYEDIRGLFYSGSDIDRFEEEADIEDEVYGSSMLVPSPIAAAGIMNFTPSPTSSVAGTYSESSITSYDPGSSHGAASAATYSQATTSQLVRNPMCNEELAKIVSNIITSSR